MKTGLVSYSIRVQCSRAKIPVSKQMTFADVTMAAIIFCMVCDHLPSRRVLSPSRCCQITVLDIANPSQLTFQILCYRAIADGRWQRSYGCRSKIYPSASEIFSTQLS